MAPLPTPRYFCDCSECVVAPTSHPTNGLPSRGRWLDKDELRIHQRQHGRAATASNAFPNDTHAIEEQFNPQDFIGFSEQSLAGPVGAKVYRVKPSKQTTPSRPSPSLPRRPEPRERSFKSSQPPLLAIEEIQTLMSSLREPEDVIQGQSPVFQNPPRLTVRLKTSAMTDDEIDRLCELAPDEPSNTLVIGYIRMLTRADAIADGPGSDVAIRMHLRLLRHKVDRHNVRLRQLLLQEWHRQRSILLQGNYLDTSRYYAQNLLQVPPSILAIYVLVTTVHLFSGLSISDCVYFLGSLRLIMQLNAQFSTDIHTKHSADHLTTNVETIVKILDLHPRSKAYVCCPKCFFLYWIDPDAATPSYPFICTNKDVDGSHCNAPLRKQKKRKQQLVETPAREFRYQSPQDYIARLYSRPDLQQYLYDNPAERTQDPDYAWDIWEGSVLRDFKGLDGNVFTETPHGQGRLVMSLNMDGFNPYRNREAGKKVTIGTIYMVCLNLPSSIRYNLENVYLVGIIPGPQQPSQHEINYILKPLVDDLIQLWHDGVKLSRTHQHRQGCLVHCAVVPLVCDLPAARQMSGFAHYRSKYFCSECYQTINHINDLRIEKWRSRSEDHHRRAASKWKRAKSSADREACVNAYGVRWSELLRLPYWNPAKFTVVDSMHAFYLRLFQHHCRSVWGMDVMYEDGMGITFDRATNHPTEEEMSQANHILRHGAQGQLSKLRAPVLRELCRETSTVVIRGKKAELVERLVEYRIRQRWFTRDGQYIDPPTEQGGEVGGRPSATKLNNGSDANNFFWTASKTAMKRTRISDLRTLFRLKVNPVLNPPLIEAQIAALRAQDLQEHIGQERLNLGIIHIDGRHKGGPPTKTRVLGRETLSAIREDMKHIIVPTWQAQSPKHPGEKKWGKFTADQWRTFCLVNLPITLIRLWGSKPVGSIERRRLDNFMHLATAVKLATMHRMSEDRIQQYEKHIRLYLESLLELYPRTNITPYQHLSLHFGRHLRSFGPVHAWRCFPFERYNYVLQRIPTNQKFGELETTMFNKFCCKQNLRALLKIEAIPTSLHALVSLFRKTYLGDRRGSRINDAMVQEKIVEEGAGSEEAPKFTNLTSHSFQLLKAWASSRGEDPSTCSRKVVSKKFTYRFGQMFAIHSYSAPDSNVILSASEDGPWNAGTIQEIFTHRFQQSDRAIDNTDQTFAIVKPFQTVENVSGDPYQFYPTAGGKIFKAKGANLILVSMKDIRSHFASRLWKDKAEILVFPLDKM